MTGRPSPARVRRRSKHTEHPESTESTKEPMKGGSHGVRP
ncbi:hypothetical protein ACVW19_006652 [Streptomyces sp. TE5632]